MGSEAIGEYIAFTETTNDKVELEIKIWLQLMPSK